MGRIASFEAATVGKVQTAIIKVGGKAYTVGIDTRVHAAEKLVGGTVSKIENVAGRAVQAAEIVVNGTKFAVDIVADAAKDAAEEVPGKEIVDKTVDEAKRMVDHFGHKTSIINSATGIFQGADKRLVSKLIDEILRRFPDLVIPETLLGTAQKLTTIILKAAIAKTGRLPIVWDGIFSNDINPAALGVIWGNGAGLAKFVVDLVEPAKCNILADSLDVVAGQNPLYGQDNELDFTKAMNRHAVICQLQRLAKSIIFILEEMATPVNKLGEIRMTEETKLRSDVISGTIITTGPRQEQASTSPRRLPRRQPQETPKVTNEKWLFINGIAGELYWLRLACEKLKNKYSRDITGVFNRGDGILWDLIECAGERTAQVEGSTTSQRLLVQRTESSSMAQEALKEELKKALKDETTSTHVVMISHSQGCLLLRLVLEELLKESVAASDPSVRDMRKTMLNRLCVFTFGNPSIDWKLEMNDARPIEPLENGDQESKDLKHLSSHVLRTEHYANKEDFVAKLGVLSENKPENSGYANDCIFVNEEKDWIGHLFGAQYSLNPDDYKANGQNSWLLACQGGRPMGDVKS
jgi:hypothetical protein